MRTLAELLGLSPPFGNPPPPPPFADWTLFSGAGTPYAPPPWAPEPNDLNAPTSYPASDFSIGGILGPHLAARAAGSNGLGGILGPVAGTFSPPPEPASARDPFAASFGQGPIPFDPAAGNAFEVPSGLNFNTASALNFGTSPGLNQGINLPWSAQPASSPQFRDTTASQTALPGTAWDETFPPTYGLPGASSAGNSGVGRDPEASYPWPPRNIAPRKLGAYRDIGDPYPSNGTVDRFTDDPSNLSAVISDAPEDRWIPGARYVQARGRRGGGRIGERELSTAETVRFTIYNHNRAVLRELDPQNPLITTQFLSTRDWIPSAYDNYVLRREVERLKYERDQGLEPHHNLPREFANRFRECGLELEDYITYLPRDLHRLLPNGLHTGSGHWNARWREYFGKLAAEKAKSEDVFRQLLKMWESAPWLKQ